MGIPDTLRPYFSRIIAPLVVWAVGKLAAKFGVVVTEEQVHAFAELAVAFILVAITHKAIDSKVNPHDVASIPVAKETKGAP